MNDNNIDRFRQEIREKLRECQNALGEEMVANHSKFNEDLEFRLEQLKTDVPPHIYDIIVQTTNYGFMRGTALGLQVGNAKVQDITAKVKEMRKPEPQVDYRPQLDELIKIARGGIGLGFIVFLIWLACQLFN